MLERLGKYRLIEMIGNGGFGTVYRGRDEELGREVAIKVLHPSVPRDLAYMEASMAAQIPLHTNVAAVFDFCTVDDVSFIVMEYVPQSLEKQLNAEGRLSISDSVDIASQVCKGLGHVQNWLIHRDVKPANILLTNNQVAKVTDFGLSKALLSSGGDVSQSSAAGTLAYMSHEQIKGDAIGKSSDVYAVGIMMYQMLTGDLPFRANGWFDWYDKHKNEPVPEIPIELSVPGAVLEILKKALNKKPADRYSDAAEMAVALSEVVDSLSPSRYIKLEPSEKAGEYYEIGREASSNFQFREAIDSFTQALEVDSDCLEAIHGRGEAYEKLGEYESAVADYNRAVKIALLNPTEHSKQIGDLYESRADAYFALKQHGFAISDYTKAAENRAPDPNLWFKRGRCAASIDQDAEAITDYSESLKLSEQNVQALYERSSSYIKLNQFQQALTDLDEIIGLRPEHVDGRIQRAMVHARLLDNQKALDDLNYACHIRPHDARAFNLRGSVHRALGDGEKAILDYSTAIEIRPHYASAYFNIGRVLAELDRHGEAVENFSVAIDLREGYSAALSARRNSFRELGMFKSADEDNETLNALLGH